MTKAVIGYRDLFIAQVSVAINTVAGKYLLAYVPVYLYLGIRFFMTSVMLYALMRILGVFFVDVDHPTGRLTRRDWWLMAASSLCAGPLFNVLMMLGMKYTTATSAGIVMSTLPAMLALFSFWLLGEKLSVRKGIGLLLAILGVVILSLDSTPGKSDLGAGSLLGDFLVFLAVLPEAMYSVLLKLLNRRVTVMGAAVIINLFSTVFVLPMMIYGAFVIDYSTVPMTAWLLFPITWLASVGFYWLWARGLQVIPTSTAGLFGGIMPVATSIIAVIFLSEIFTLYAGVGMSLVIISIIVGTGARIRFLRRT